jgi:hypothetical protein
MYVLLIVLAGSHAAMSQNIKFDSQQLCEKAKSQLEKSTNYAHYRTLECLRIKEK